MPVNCVQGKEQVNDNSIAVIHPFMYASLHSVGASATRWVEWHQRSRRVEHIKPQCTHSLLCP